LQAALALLGYEAVATTPKTKKQETPPDDRKTLYVRLPAPLHEKVRRIAARRAASSSDKVSLQDVVISMITSAPST
jgi:hypothetical protein